MNANEILKKHEDANEMHFHEVDRKLIIDAMEEYADSKVKNFSSNLPVICSLPFPSKDETKLEARHRWGDYFQMRDAFELGAEWIKEKLVNGNGL